MCKKYEVTYWDWRIGKEFITEYTNSFFRVIYILLKLEMVDIHASVKFKGNKI